MFINKFHNQYYLFIQKIKKNLFYIKVYKNTKISTYYKENLLIVI